MKFPYIKVPTYDPIRKWISRPLIPIILSGPKGSITIDALVDSGADRSLFHLEIGKRLGLDLFSAPTEFFSGIEAGRLSSYLLSVDMQIMGLDKKVSIPAGFVESDGVSAILGQDGFFDAFRIKFEKQRNTIEIVLAQ